MPEVSVIIPTYNRGRLLEQALRSVAAQTYRDFEILVIDDGGQEDLRPVCAAAGIPVRLLRIPHAGPAAARNGGIEAAAGRFLAFLDSDDTWQPEHLRRTVPILKERPEVGLVYHPFVQVDPRGAVQPLRWPEPLPSGRVTRELFAEDFIPTICVVCRADLVRQAGGFDVRLQTGEDYDLWLRLSLRCAFVGLPDPLARRLRHEGNTCKRQRTLTAVRHAVLRERFYRRHGGGLIDRRYARRVLARAFYRAGRCLQRDGEAPAARRALARSLLYNRFRPACLWAYLMTNLPRRGAGGAPDDPLTRELAVLDWHFE